jgi:branched-chain amino acid transport system substrate-binding protein
MGRRTRGQRCASMSGIAVILVASGVLAACSSSGSSGSDSASVKTVKIAAIEPLSGLYAATGHDELLGAQFAAQQINAAGGIKALGGAKVQVVPFDAGATPASATTAAETAMSESDISGAVGSFVSSLTLAEVAVSELHQMPLVTGSGADQIVQSGSKYVFKILSNAVGITDGIKEVIQNYLPAAPGGVPDVAWAGDNNPNDLNVYNDLKSGADKGLVKFVAAEIWTPPLTDATPVVSAVISAKPSLVILNSTSTADSEAVLRGLLAQGSTIPRLGIAATWANPGYATTPGVQAMNGFIIPSVGLFPGNGSAPIVTAYSKYAHQPWMDAEAVDGYSSVEILAAAMQNSGSSNKQQIATTLHTKTIENWPQLKGIFLGSNSISFEADGERTGATYTLIEWINGQPRTFYPASFADSAPVGLK